MNPSNSFRAWMTLGLVLSATQVFGTTNFYAPYDVSYNLTIGSPSAASATNGTVTSVLGMTNAIGGNTGNAVHFDATSSLDYGSAASYVPDFGDSGIGVKSNTFRLLIKPDFSGNPTSFRANFLGLGALGAADGIYLAHSDVGRPAFRVSFNGNFQDNLLPASFAWDSNTWYYMAASLDASSSMLYVRALTNGSTPFFQTLTYGTAVNWGVGGYGSTALRAGGRWNNANEGARGTLDEILILNNAKWNLSDFNYDFALIIPEPTTAVLFLAGMGFIGSRRFRH